MTVLSSSTVLQCRDKEPSAAFAVVSFKSTLMEWPWLKHIRCPSLESKTAAYH